MNSKDLLRALGDIDDKYLEEEYETPKDKNKKEFFSRTFIISKDKEIKDDTALLKIEFESAWSIYSCMMKEENDKNKNCLTLKEAIDKYEVERIVIKAIETGISFEESIIYDRKFYNDISYQSRELYLDPVNEYLN